MKKVSVCLRLGSIFLFVAFLTSGFSQGVCTRVNSLVINTGYNPVTASLYPAGTQDPNWIISALSAPVQPLAPPLIIGNGAYSLNLVPPNIPGGWINSTTTNGGSAWVSCTPNGQINTPQSNQAYTMTLTRTFANCIADTYTFNFGFADDNFATYVGIDLGANLITQQPSGNLDNNYGTFQNISTTLLLAAGTHTITITVQNLTAFQAEPNNWFGLNVNGTIAGTVNSLISPASPANCSCAPICSDTCYWKVTGNTIVDGNNVFGTMSNNDIRIFSSANQRGAIMANGFFGWQTNSPNTLFHIDCANPGERPSNLRFENLRDGEGAPLLIDKNGYVFFQKGSFRTQENTNTQGQITKRLTELETQNKFLLQELSQLKSQLKKSSSTLFPTNNLVDKSSSENKLFQNKPNPFSSSTTIESYISSFKLSAFIKIYDLSGKELVSYKLINRGTNMTQVNQKQLVSGMYLYSLIVDGEEIDTKKMVVSGN